MPKRLVRAVTGALLCLTPAALTAQEAPAPLPADDPTAGTVFDGDWITLGAGVAYSPSYDGSDDYVFTPLPAVAGSIGGVSFAPRGAGLAFDFIPDRNGEVGLNLGVAARINRNRAARIEDRVVSAYGKLDTAIEVGPSVGVTIPGVLHQYDRLSLSLDAVWDLAGAHNGMTINPSVNYLTPLSRGTAVVLSLSARHVDDDYADYYYSVPVAPAALPVSDRLPVFDADGGFDNVGASVLFGYDFDGDLTNGGLAGVLIGSYSRMTGDAADTPFTSIRGSRDQWFAGVGLGYTF